MTKGGLMFFSKNAKVFENQTTATDKQYACALRFMKGNLEEYLQMRLTDELFLELYNLQIQLPLPQITAGKYGYPHVHKEEAREAFGNVLEKHKYQRYLAEKFIDFFWEQSTGTIDLGYPAIILNIPHSSTNIPRRYANVCSRTNGVNQWKKVSRNLIDYYTDELFLPQEENESIDALVFDMCRTLCDVERLPHDPLEEKGLGIVLNVDNDGLRNTLGDANSTLYGELMNKYMDYQYKLSKLIIKHANHWMDSLRDTPLLLDCHSFSNHLTWLCNDSRTNEIDICIGFNDDETRPSDFFISKVARHFEQLGYTVELNVPFSNSKTVPVPVQYHSLMIEVNKSLYMNEDTLEKTDGFDTLQKAIQDLYKTIIH